jgi:hypothetical protein
MGKVDSHCGGVTVLMTHYGKSGDGKWMFKTYSQSQPLSTKFLQVFVIIMVLDCRTSSSRVCQAQRLSVRGCTVRV